MTETLGKLVDAVLGGTGNGLVAILMLIIGYLAWNKYNTNKEHREDVKQYREVVDKLQTLISDKNGEEREMLLSIIEKYHQSQISIREAISEVKAVLTTISVMTRRGG